MRVTIFANKPNEELQLLITALANGFITRGDVVWHVSIDHEDPLEVEDWTQLACFVTPDPAFREIYDFYMKAGRHTLIVDKGYFLPDENWRFALDGFQSQFIYSDEKKPDRLTPMLAKSGLALSVPGPITYPKNVLYVGESDASAAWHGLGKAQSFDANQCRALHSALLSKVGIIWVAEWPDDGREFYLARQTLKMYKEDVNIPNLLIEADCVVTYANRAGFLALLAGVPISVTSPKGISPVWSLASKGFTQNTVQDSIQHRSSLEERIVLLNRLAWTEFNLDEITTGLAAESLEPYNVKRIEKIQPEDPNDPAFVIEQYKLMHSLGNRYRGGLHDDVIEHISAMVKKHKANTLLDYGSGKGRQYEEHKSHKNWGGILPTCYDPGYAPFSQKPEGRFDGVICTDVAEHVPTRHVGEFLEDVISYSQKFIMFVIFTGLARKTLPDGRNCHLTVKSPKWWLGAIAHSLKKSKSSFELVTFTELKEDPPTYRIQLEGGLKGVPEIKVVFRLKE